MLLVLIKVHRERAKLKLTMVGQQLSTTNVGFVDHIAKFGCRGCQHQENNTKTRIYCLGDAHSVQGRHIHANGFIVVVSCHESLRLTQNATPRARMTLNRDRVFLCGSLHSPHPCITPCHKICIITSNLIMLASIVHPSEFISMCAFASNFWTEYRESR